MEIKAIAYKALKLWGYNENAKSAFSKWVNTKTVLHTSALALVVIALVSNVLLLFLASYCASGVTNLLGITWNFKKMGLLSGVCGFSGLLAFGAVILNIEYHIRLKQLEKLHQN